MRVDKIIARLETALQTHNAELLRSIVQDLGHELPRRRKNVIDEFRVGAAIVLWRCGDTITPAEKATVDTMIHLALAWEASVSEEDKRAEDLLFGIKENLLPLFTAIKQSNKRASAETVAKLAKRDLRTVVGLLNGLTHSGHLMYLPDKNRYFLNAFGGRLHEQLKRWDAMKNKDVCKLLDELAERHLLYRLVGDPL